MAAAVPDPGPPPSSLRYRVFVAVALLAAAAAMWVAYRSTNTDEDPLVSVSGRRVVEQLVPGNGESELRQSEFGIDLAPGYEAILIVNGVQIPEGDLRQVPAQAQVWFTPGEGKAIEELPAGQTCVVALVWRTIDGRGPGDQNVRWCFSVT